MVRSGNGLPVVLVDGDRSVLFANGSARDVFARRGPLAVVDGRLACTDSTCQAEFVAALRAVAAGRAGEAVVALRHDGQVLDLAATLTALPGDAAPRVLVTLHRPSHVPGGLTDDAFAFTPAEARVAALIRRGEPPKRVATELGIALPTVKSHLQSLFGKTGTRRQAELVHVLLTASPAHAARVVA